MKKYLLVDTETTGLNEFLNEVLTVSGAILTMDDDMKVVDMDQFDIKMRPENLDTISDKALERNGISLEEALTWQSQEDGCKEFRKVLHKAVGSGFKRDRDDKLFWFGYNADFDKKFLNNLFEEQCDRPLVQWTNFITIDPMHMVYRLRAEKGMYSELENLRLETLCEHYGIEIDAHNSLSDAMATYNLYIELKKEEECLR